MSERGRVAQLTSVHPPFDRRICVQCASLADAGWSVTYVSQEGEIPVKTIERMPIPVQSNRLRRSLISSWHVFTRARKSGARICHFHDPELIPVGVLLSILGRKVIYDVHEDMPLLILNKFWLKPWLRKPMAYIAALTEWFTTRFVFSAVVAATPPIARRFPQDKTVTVQNFPEIEFQSDQGDALPLAQRANCAVYIGILDENRGSREIIEALGHSRNGNTTLILGGKFSGETIEDDCRALPTWPRVDFRGWLDRKQVQAALAEAKVGLITLAPIPNYLESYPTKLFEYMAAGIPVIASDFPLLRSIVEGADCGLLVDPTDPKEIAKAIDWLIDHPEDAARMGANGKRAARDTYNWHGEARKLTLLYEKLWS